MFSGGRAWFSQSVPRDLCEFWVAEGGIITNHVNADYLFSSNASHPDTESIYQSADYVEDRATVFHSSYLSAVGKSEIRDMVALGHFILPPSCLQEEIKRQIGSFIWEQSSDSVNELQKSEMAKIQQRSSETQVQRITTSLKSRNTSKTTSDFRIPVLGKLSYCSLQSYPVNNMVTGYISIDALKRYSGELHDFTPGSSGYLAYRIED